MNKNEQYEKKKVGLYSATITQAWKMELSEKHL